MAYTCAVPGINLADYSKGPLQRGWGNPCSGTMARVQLTVAAVSVDTRLAELVGLIMRANERDGYRYRAVDTGAYNCRKIAGTDTWSNHAWGAAVDCNWQSNPFTAALQTDRPAWEIDRWARYGWAWGGKYTGKKDAMHSEFMGTPAQAQAALVLARKELGSTTAATPTGGFLMALTDAQQLRLLEWADKGLYSLANVRENTDRLPAIHAAVDQLRWGVLDESQGLRVAVAGLYARLADGAEITAEELAAVIPEGLAGAVVDELQRRQTS